MSVQRLRCEAVLPTEMFSLVPARSMLMISLGLHNEAESKDYGMLAMQPAPLYPLLFSCGITATAETFGAESQSSLSHFNYETWALRLKKRNEIKLRPQKKFFLEKD